MKKKALKKAFNLGSITDSLTAVLQAQNIFEDFFNSMKNESFPFSSITV